MISTNQRIRRSMLWSAYGDALGFITELCDLGTLSYRTGGKSRVTGLIPWKRKIGGRYGVPWDLPAGCYSDDTQLRLAVCRSIRGDGVFDVELFAKVELPIFLAYGLGAGRGTKSAAESLKKVTVQWNTNFYETKSSSYLDSGGNGAAMRIQPHVWSARSNSSDASLLRGVVRDAVVTHGHPVAIVGAAFHALLLSDSMASGKAAAPDSWISVIWLPEWERRAGHTFAEGVRRAISDAVVYVEQLTKGLAELECNRSREQAYAYVVEFLGATDEASRGSGIKTTILAAYLAAVFSDDPIAGLTACANVIGSDTDTIGTMAGALLGSIVGVEPPQRVQDYDYLIREADRMASVREGGCPTTHAYPDLLSWSPPASSIDAIATDGTRLILRGFGVVSGVGRPLEQKGSPPIVWQECTTDFGQTMIIKRRKEPGGVTEKDLPRRMRFEKNDARTVQRASVPQVGVGHASHPSGAGDVREHVNADTVSVDDASDAVIRSGFDPVLIGRSMLALAEQDNGVDKVIGFAAIVAKAKCYRMRRDQGKQ